ncbi:Peptidase G1 [Tylopilus felleus]
MLFNFALVSSVLFAPAVLADRHPVNHQSEILNRRAQSTNTGPNKITSTNWAGALWTKDNGTFTSINGTFTVPHVTGSNGYAAAAWIGIDGYKCVSLFHAGVNFVVTDHGPVYYAWHEWFPADYQNFTGVSISAGDVIRLSIKATSRTSGTAKIENLSNGEGAVEEVKSKHALCELGAEWVVEDYRLGVEGNGRFAPFAMFSPVTFTDAVAAGPTSTRHYTPAGATIVNAEQNSVLLTSVTIVGDTVTIQRLPG